jgi:hypothetical protein
LEFPWIVKRLVRKNVGNFLQNQRLSDKFGLQIVMRRCMGFELLAGIRPADYPEKNITSVMDRRIAAAERTCAYQRGGECPVDQPL